MSSPPFIFFSKFLSFGVTCISQWIRIRLRMSAKMQLSEILVGIISVSKNQFGEHCHLNTIKFSIQDHGMSLLLFIYFFVYFTNVFWFLIYTSFVKFVRKYFILFDGIINGLVFISSVLHCSLLVWGRLLIFIYWSYMLQPWQTYLLV